MKIDLVATGGGRYRVFRDGVELSAHTAQHTAFEAGIAAKQAALGSLVEVVTDFRVRIEITDTVPAPAPEPEPEPTPNPEPPPILADGTLLRDVASTLQAGEWRRVPTTLPEGLARFKDLQYVHGNEMQSGGADGMGWTERLIEHKGTLMLPLMRDFFTKAMIVMDAAGKWHRIDEPQGWNREKSERRPFNRWFKKDGFACFAPADEKPAMGYVLRTPLGSPGVFERHGIAIGDGAMDSVGNFSMCEAWGRLWAYTPGGRLRSWAEGDAAWVNNYAHIPSTERASGFAGTVIYNPVRDEVLAIGGQYFGSNPDVSDRGMRVTSPDAPSEMFSATFEDGSRVLGLTSAESRLLYHPVTGEYLMLYHDGQMYRSVDGRVWRLYQDLRMLKPWGGYEQYCPWALLEGTDVIVMVSHTEGVWLHKLLP